MADMDRHIWRPKRLTQALSATADGLFAGRYDGLESQPGHWTRLNVDRDALEKEAGKEMLRLAAEAAAWKRSDQLHAEKERRLAEENARLKKDRAAELRAAQMMGWIEGADAAFKEMGVDAEEERFSAFYLDKNPHRPENARREVERLLGLPGKGKP